MIFYNYRVFNVSKASFSIILSFPSANFALNIIFIPINYFIIFFYINKIFINIKMIISNILYVIFYIYHYTYHNIIPNILIFLGNFYLNDLNTGPCALPPLCFPEALF